MTKLQYLVLTCVGKVGLDINDVNLITFLFMKPTTPLKDISGYHRTVCITMHDLCSHCFSFIVKRP